MLNREERGSGGSAATPGDADGLHGGESTRAIPPEATSTPIEDVVSQAQEGLQSVLPPRLFTPELVEQAWKWFAECTSPQLADDLRTVLGAHAKGANALQCRRGIFALFDDLASAEEGTEAAIVAALYSKPSEGAATEADVQRVCLVFGAWYRRQLAVRASQAYAFDMARATAFVLQWLGALPSGRYPKYLRRFHKVEKPGGNTRSLGSLRWQELSGLSGHARERKALDIVAKAAAADFEVHLRLFEFGQAVLAAAEPPPEVDPEAWLAVKKLLTSARKALPERGNAKRRPAAFAAGSDVALRSRRTWLSAGLPQCCLDAVWTGKRTIVNSEVGWLALGGLASTEAAVIAAATMFVCRTGWNKQPTLDLARRPIVFEGPEGIGVASAKFLACFKRRARHPVLARLEDCRKVDGLLREDLEADWHAAETELDPDEGDEGNIILDRRRDGGILDMLDGFGRMADAARDLDPLCRAVDRFFINPPLIRCKTVDGLTTQSRFGLELSSAEVLRRDGVTFRSIRKTFLVIKYLEKGSVAATTAHSGHTDESQLLGAYLDTADVKAEHDRAIRAYQQVCQALLLAGDPERRIALRIPSEQLEWFLGLARASGIAAGLGVLPGVMPGPPAAPLFHPTTANLRDLFLAHWALRRAATLLPPGTWRARCLPLLAAAKAIGSALCAKGLRRTYFAAARSAHRALLEGNASLPPIEGA